MSDEAENIPGGGVEFVSLNGELSKRLSWAPLRVLAIVSGFTFLRGLFTFCARYLLMLRRPTKVALDSGCLIVESQWSILGKRFLETKTEASIDRILALRLENRTRYIHLLVGFAALSAGTWIGLQLLVDGLNASYPYLALIGAGCVVLGALLDFVLYVFVPSGKGRSRLILALGPWQMRIAGVDWRDAERLVLKVRSTVAANARR